VALDAGVARPPVVLVRHGETEWSRDGRHTGISEIDLTERGREQASQLRPRLTAVPYRVVAVSPRRRAQETCRLAGLGDRATVDPDLAEWDYGRYEGLTTAQIRAERPEWSLWRDGCPRGEGPADVAARADRVIARARSAGGAVVLFAHGHILRVIGARWIGLGPEYGSRFVLATGGVSELGWEHDEPAITGWNESVADTA
jgi:probable phosphoglycerate mutase